MKSLSEEALDALEAGSAIEVGAVEILCDPPLRVWGGPWPTQIDGHDYVGIGDRGLVKSDGASIGAAAQNITLELSGVEPAHLDLLDAGEVQGAPVVLRRMIFDGGGTQLLDVHVLRRGRVDQVVSEETVGGEAILRGLIEGAARGLGRRGSRMRSDADQRLVNADDGGMRHVTYAGEKMLYWGGKAPAAASAALPGAASYGGGGGRFENIQEQ